PCRGAGRPCRRNRYRVEADLPVPDRKSTRLNSSHTVISYAVFCLKKIIGTPGALAREPLDGDPLKPARHRAQEAGLPLVFFKDKAHPQVLPLSQPDIPPD